MPAKVKIIKHSRGPHGKDVVTWEARYWRAIHGELLTHRDFSRSSSSSRAVPVKRMLAQVWKDPAGPMHWGANRPGMQATEQLTGWRLVVAKLLWRSAAKFAALHSWAMMKVGLHKQVANRATEPYQYIHTLITTTERDNFYKLRRHKDAMPEMRDLADAMYEAEIASTPELLKPGQWHLPFVTPAEVYSYGLAQALKMSTARNARVSFLNHDGSNPNPVRDYKLHDDLVGSDPIHASPAEHAVECMPDNQRYANLVGFRSYRMAVECRALRVNGQLRPLNFGGKQRD